MNNVLKTAGLVVVALFVLALLSLAGLAWRYYTAEVRGKVDAQVQIESAPSRITRYEHYFDLCAAVQGYEGALTAQRALLSSADGKEAERVRANIAGIAAQRARAIAQYNADASKSYTSARFLGASLPRSLDVNAEFTTCN